MQLIDRTNKALFSTARPIWQSPEGNLLDLEMNATFPLAKITARPPNMWRYREALPIENDWNILSLNEGFTPLLPVNLNGKIFKIKQEHLFSTGSYKDRGASVLMSKVKELGITEVVQDSSGNAGCAIAAYAAMALIQCTIYVQAQTSESKLTQMRAYGAHLKLIDGSREDVAAAALEAAKQTYYASHCYNPFFVHGTKTFAYELCEQLGWKVPDSIVLPAGNGTLIIGSYIGLMDLVKAGIITKMPKLIAVQAANCSPLAASFNGSLVEQSSPTLAEGIAIAQPVRGQHIMDCVRASNGLFVTVTESEIKDAWKTCAQQGFYIEPTSAATIAGAMRYAEGYEEEIATLFSGHGLKSTATIQKILQS
jgi:threonine synthase